MTRFAVHALLGLIVAIAPFAAVTQSWAAGPALGSSGHFEHDNLRRNGASSDFELERHGFRFANNWDDVYINLPQPFDDVELESESFGLCGGMIYAAHDSFYQESTSDRLVQTPATEEVPGPASDLRNYIYHRQIDSLQRDGFFALRALGIWVQQTDRTLRSWTWRSFARDVAPGINKGWAIPLMLVMNDDPFKLTGNHQVLAIGYERRTLKGAVENPWRVRVYDPNCPEVESYLNLSDNSKTCGSRTKFRGFFVTKYKGQRPPWAGGRSLGPWRPGADLPPLRDGLGTDKGLPKPEALPEGDAPVPSRPGRGTGGMQEAPGAQKAQPDVPLHARKYKDKFKGKGQPVSGQYSLDLVSLDSRKIWYQTIGNNDLVILNLWAYDTGRATETVQFVSTTYKASSRERQSLGFARLFGAFPEIKGQLKIGGTLILAHPQNFKNVRDAMRRMVDLEFGVAGTVVRIKEIPGLAQLLGRTDTLELIKQFQADFRSELIIALGKLVSLGQNDCLNYVAPIDITLTEDDLRRNANEEFRLWYEIRGAKAATCWREIKYELIARTLRD